MYVKPDLTGLARQNFLVKSSSSWEEAAKEPVGNARGGAASVENQRTYSNVWMWIQMPSFEISGCDKVNLGNFTRSARYLYHDVNFELKLFDYGEYNLWLA